MTTVGLTLYSLGTVYNVTLDDYRSRSFSSEQQEMPSGIDINASLCIKCITNKNLPYSTGNFTPYPLKDYVGKNL